MNKPGFKFYVIGSPEKQEIVSILKHSFPIETVFLNGQETRKIFSLMEKIEAAEKNAFLRSQAPRWILSNFALVGPGFLLALEKNGEIVGDIRVVSGWKMRPSVHIWSFFINSSFQRQKSGTLLFAALLISIKSWARTITFSVLPASPSLRLYLKAGQNKILAVHHFDLGEKNPKLFIEAEMPQNPHSLFKSSFLSTDFASFKPVQHFTDFSALPQKMAILANSTFWQDFAEQSKDYQKNLRIVNWDKDGPTLFLEKF